MPSKRSKAKESQVPYHTKRQVTVPKLPSRVALRWIEIENATAPIILERNGQPMAVVIKYADYQRMDAARTERREKAWRELDALLAQIHARTHDFPIEEIEADITVARQEVREQRNALRHRD